MAKVDNSSVKFCFGKKQRSGLVAGKKLGLNRSSVRWKLYLDTLMGLIQW